MCVTLPHVKGQISEQEEFQAVNEEKREQDYL